MREFTHLVTPSQTLNIIKEDPEDNRILECAAEAGSDVIVSGDKDFHRVKQYGKVRVVQGCRLHRHGDWQGLADT